MEIQRKGKQEVEARMLHSLCVSAVSMQLSDEVRLKSGQKKEQME